MTREKMKKMKKISSLLFLWIVAFGTFAGCQKEEQADVNPGSLESTEEIKTNTEDVEFIDNNNEIETQETNYTDSMLGKKLDEEKIIKEYSFIVGLGDWGNVQFVPYKANANADQVSFLLANDNEVIYEFPNYEKDTGFFESIKDIGFIDVNSDGVEDIILVINSIINDDSNDPVVQPSAIIYLTGENEFQLAQDMINDVSKNIQAENLTVNCIEEYLVNVSN